MHTLYNIFFCTCILCLVIACSTSPREQPLAKSPDSVCTVLCDAVEPAIPVLTDSTGVGNITTYGSVQDPQPSAGGACNYGKTQVYNFAAASVSLAPGDLKGLWNGGHICGQCVQVRVPSPLGFRSVVVRLMDKCPDAYCGIDLGGAPARTLMGDAPGRYSGEWKYVSCANQDSVSDGAPSLVVKEGSNAWWALIQVHNGPGATDSIRYESLDGKHSGTFPWATEAENFFKVPNNILADTAEYILRISYSDKTQASVVVKGSVLSVENSSIEIP